MRPTTTTRRGLDPPAGRMEGIMPKFDAAAVAAYETAAKMFPGLIYNFRFDREERGMYWFTFRREDLPDAPAPYSISVRWCNA